MVSTLQSYIYEDLHPKIEKKDTPESQLLIVHIPDGFTRGDIGAKVEYDFGRIRVFGERSIGSNKMIRFNEKYQVPSHCDIGNIKGKIDGKIVTITMPKIPGKIPEPEPIEENNQQNTSSDQDSKSNVESKEDQTPQEAQKVTQEENSQKGQVTKVDSKEEASHETQTSQESIPQKGQEEVYQNESLPQKGQEEISPKETVPQKGQEEISQNESLPQKDQEEISQKSQVTKVESKGEAYHEISAKSEGAYESMPQKSEDQETLNKATDTKDAKLQTEENKPSPKDENKEKIRVVKEETKDYLKKTIEETKEESKGSATEETLTPKKTYKEKGKEMINDKFGDDDEKKSDKKGIHESTRTRIKDMALSTTQAVTNYAKRFNEEDKQKLIYTGATILVVALGVYASYKYRSSRRS